jgi:hypothetical protein
MHDLARALLVGGVVMGTLLGLAACWKVAPDSDNALTLPEGSAEATLIDSILVTPETGTGTGWEGGDDGGSGDGGSSEAEAPAPVVTVPTASPALATGVGFGCNIHTDGSVWCWGDDTFGQAGSTPSSTTVGATSKVAGVSNAVALALGDHHACAVTTAHAVYCWGLDDAYQLGHVAGTEGDQICPGAGPGQTVPCASTPSLVAGLSPASAIAAAGAWTCILATDGTVECWGGMQPTTTDAGVACGLGAQASGGTCYPAPYVVAGIHGASQLAVAYDHACVVVPGGEAGAVNQVSCWGQNNEGQVSPSACPQSTCAAPIARSDLPTTASLAAGDQFTCALAGDGTVRCFGDNTDGQLGHGPSTAGDQGAADPDGGFGVYNLAPVEAPFSATTALASLVGGGNESMCALLPTGTAECWGNVAAGGGGSATPVIVAVTALTALGTYDGAYVCGLSAADGSVWCFTLGSTAGPVNIMNAVNDGG